MVFPMGCPSLGHEAIFLLSPDLQMIIKKAPPDLLMGQLWEEMRVLLTTHITTPTETLERIGCFGWFNRL